MHYGKDSNLGFEISGIGLSYTDSFNLLKVGDPKQLPATVLSNVASKFLYECSMFERLQRAGHPVIMLNEQVYWLQHYQIPVVALLYNHDYVWEHIKLTKC